MNMLGWIRSKLDRRLVAAGGVIEALRANQGTTRPRGDSLEGQSPSDDAWLPGDVVEGIYTVKKVFREGGMGWVCQVHHRDWGVDLALKCPRTEYFQTEGQREAFTNECQTWIALGLHPNVAVCHYVRLIHDVPCVFAEFVDGGSLADWIGQRRLYSPDQLETLLRLLDVGIQFAYGINHAHQSGIIHRDVKPSNALLTSRGQLKVTDFGLAKAMSAAAESGPSSGGHYAEWLTPAYSSPEQSMRRPVSKATDVWSWAVSFLEMFVGGVTWERGSAAGFALEEYLKTGPLHREIPTMPDPVARLLRSCLDAIPSKRPSSMVEIAAVLQSCYETFSSGAYPRPVPKGLPLGADAFNNRALSFLDLGQQDEAMAAWQQALMSDPEHAESLYNSGMVLWRSGSKTDEFALARLPDVAQSDPARASWKVHLFRAQIHTERGDLRSAKHCLELSGRLGGDPNLLGQANKMISSVPRRDWDIGLEMLRGHEDDVVGVSFCEGGRVISASRDQTLRLWDVRNRSCLKVLRGHSDEIRCLLCLPGSHIAFSGGRDGILNEWNLRTGERRYVTNDSQINCVVSDYRGLTAIGDAEGRVKLWDSSSNRLTVIGTQSDAVAQLVFSMDSQALISRNFEGAEKRWSVSPMNRDSDPTVRNTGGTDSQSPGPPEWAACLRWELAVASVDWLSPDGNHGWAHDVANDRSALLLRQFIPEGQRCLCSLRYPFPEFVKPYKRKTTAFSVEPSGTRWCAGLADGSVLFGSLPGFAKPSPSPYAVSRVMPMADVWSAEDRLARLCKEAEMLIARSDWGRARGLLLPDLEVSVRTARGVADLWARLGKRARRTNVLKAQYRVPVDVDTTPATANEAKHPEIIRGRFAIYSNHAGGVFLRDTISGVCFQSFAGHRDQILDMAVSPDDSVAVSCSRDGTVRFWDLVNRRCAKVFRGQSTVQKLAFNPSGDELAGGCQDGSVLLFDASTQSSQELMRCDSGPVKSLAFTPDGQSLLVGTRELIVVNLLSKDCTALSDAGPVAAIRISTDGLSVDLGGGTKNTWELFWDYEYPSGELLVPPVLARLKVFLEQHRPFASDDPFDPHFLSRSGHPGWDSNDFDDLLADLAQRGLGWASSEAIERGLRDRLRILSESGNARTQI